MELTCPASFGRDVETRKQEKQPGWEIKDGKDCPVWWKTENKINQERNEKHCEDGDMSLTLMKAKQEEDTRGCWGFEEPRPDRYPSSSLNQTVHPHIMFKWRVLHILQTLLSWKLSSTVFTLSSKYSFCNWVITFFPLFNFPSFFPCLIILVVFWLSSVLHRVHTGGNSLIVHHFEAASWSLAEVTL